MFEPFFSWRDTALYGPMTISVLSNTFQDDKLIILYTTFNDVDINFFTYWNKYDFKTFILFIIICKSNPVAEVSSRTATA